MCSFHPFRLHEIRHKSRSFKLELSSRSLEFGGTEDLYKSRNPRKPCCAVERTAYPLATQLAKYGLHSCTKLGKTRSVATESTNVSNSGLEAREDTAELRWKKKCPTSSRLKYKVQGVMEDYMPSSQRKNDAVRHRGGLYALLDTETLNITLLLRKPRTALLLFASQSSFCKLCVRLCITTPQRGVHGQTPPGIFCSSAFASQKRTI